ncbi:MAG: hypothetical protein ACOX6T_04010 [Myxococcales bacterium]|jgi:hypothetical protein
MRVLNILSVLALFAAFAMGYLANEARVNASRANSRNGTLEAEVNRLRGEVQSKRDADPAPLKFAEDAISEFFSRTVEAGEVLGAGVRVEPRNASTSSKALTFQPFLPGVQMSAVTLSAGLEASGAAAIVAMLEEELADLPVTVRKVTARNSTDVVILAMDVDVFGR